jgi:senataxin
LLSKNLDQRGTFIEVPGQQQSSSAAKKLLVCAPSNAAVDELVMRFKTGIKTLTGQERKLNIVRIGRGDAVNANVKDVTLEELVNKQLGLVTSNKNNDAEATRKIFEEHKQISEQLRMVRGQMDSGLVKGPDAVKLQADLNTLRQQKALLGTKIDNAKDMEKVQSRDADINRKKAQQKILGDAHVICATLSGSGNEMFQGLSVEFETVIVDEAAQCVEMSALIPLKYGCSRCILVGDPKQLPPTVFSKQAAKFQYEQSLFVRMQSNHPNDVHLLDTQYRMHPEISLFPSQTFYDGRLLDGGNMAGLRKRPWHVSSLLGPYRFFDVQGQQQAAPKGHSLINIAEINIALALYKRLTADFHSFNFKGKIGIITPYKSQLSALKERFGNVYGPSIVEDVEFNTTDAFQGRESEVIIFSCVRASPAGGIGFLQDIRRMNVGLTRAKSSLWVLGNSQSLSRGEFWNKLLEDAKRRDRFTAGNVLNMLSKHSNAFPAPVDNTPMLQEILERPQTIEEEPNIPSMSHTPVDQSNSGGSASKSAGIFRGYIKQEIKTEIKQEAMEGFGKGSNGKRKLSLDEDVEMVDADVDGDSEAASNSNTVSRQSTPASAALAPKVEATTANAPDMDPLAKMTNPKIRRKRPKEANLFMAKRPKKS